MGGKIVPNWIGGKKWSVDFFVLEWGGIFKWRQLRGNRENLFAAAIHFKYQPENCAQSENVGNIERRTKCKKEADSIKYLKTLRFKGNYLLACSKPNLYVRRRCDTKDGSSTKYVTKAQESISSKGRNISSTLCFQCLFFVLTGFNCGYNETIWKNAHVRCSIAHEHVRLNHYTGDGKISRKCAETVICVGQE